MENLLNSIKEAMPFWLNVFSGFLIAFGITVLTIPAIVHVAQMKNLCAVPNNRTSHMNATPNLGGIALFFGFIISTTIIAGDSFTSELFYIICCLIILIFVGMKDDILIIDPKKKLAAQFLVALIISVLAGIKINNFFEIFSIGALPYMVSIIMTVMFILVVINGFNLIDGIDGLASGVGILTSSVFGIWFWHAGNFAYTVICFSLTGSLLAFFIYNVFGKENKIFMGDTGSLFLGLIISVVALQFLQQDVIDKTHNLAEPSLSLLFGILILPMFDLLRIFTIRISQGRSPFIADHQHIHHRLLELGYSHLKSTVVLLLFNITIIAFCLLFNDLGNVFLIALVLSIASALSYMLLLLAKRHTRNDLALESRQIIIKTLLKDTRYQIGKYKHHDDVVPDLNHKGNVLTEHGKSIRESELPGVLMGVVTLYKNIILNLWSKNKEYIYGTHDKINGKDIVTPQADPSCEPANNLGKDEEAEFSESFDAENDNNAQSPNESDSSEVSEDLPTEPYKDKVNI